MSKPMFCVTMVTGVGRSVPPLLLLKDLIEGVSPAAAGRLTVLASVLLRGAPPGHELEARRLAVTRRAGRG